MRRRRLTTFEIEITMSSACCLECYNANTFVIDFEAKQTTREKIGLLGATLLIVSIHSVSASPGTLFEQQGKTTNWRSSRTKSRYKTVTAINLKYF